MDGVKNEKEEEKIFDINVQSNPVFEKEEIKSYNPHSPCNDDYIEIKVYKQDRTLKNFHLWRNSFLIGLINFVKIKKNNLCS